MTRIGTSDRKPARMPQATPHHDGRKKMWSRIMPLLVGLVVITTVTLFIRAEFAPIVDPALLNGWAAYMGACGAPTAQLPCWPVK